MDILLELYGASESAVKEVIEKELIDMSTRCEILKGMTEEAARKYAEENNWALHISQRDDTTCLGAFTSKLGQRIIKAELQKNIITNVWEE